MQFWADTKLLEVLMASYAQQLIDYVPKERPLQCFWEIFAGFVALAKQDFNSLVR